MIFQRRFFDQRHTLCLAALLIASVAPTLAQAEEETAAPTLTEIVVTAQRRPERLQDVPLSVQVISGSKLNQQNLDALATLAQTVPGVHIETAGRSVELYIRGIGSGQNQSFDQSVGMFVDDIYHGRSRLSMATFFDLDRVEVLKGPQSTFFGNNAIAGALNIVTHQPDKTFDGSARVLYGQYGQYVAEGAIGGPLTDTLAVRVAGTVNGMSGWINNTVTGKNMPSEDNAAGRIALAWTPIENFDATLKVEAGNNRSGGATFLQLSNCPPPAPFVLVAGQPCATYLAHNAPIGINDDSNASVPGTGTRLTTQEDVLTLNARHWGHTFTSVSGFSSYNYDLNFDNEQIGTNFLNINAPERYHQFSEELRVASPTGGRIEYLGGLYFQTDELVYGQNLGYFFLSPTISTLAPFAALVPYLPIGQEINYTQPEHVYSAFGSLSWNITDRFTLSGGLRASRVDKSYTQNLYYGTQTQSFGGIVPLPSNLQPLPNALGLGPPGTLSGSRSDHALMPSVRIQYKLDPAKMLYFSYSRGFKAGGFNGVDNSGVAANLPFQPEHVNAYELGIKTEWLNDALLVNLDVFRSDYTNLQSSVSITTSSNRLVSVVQNAAASRSQGFELETQWAVTRSLRLSANATYLDAYYIEYPNVPLSGTQRFCRANPTQSYCLDLFPGGVGATQDLSGKPPPYSPRWSASVVGAYSIALPGQLRLTTELSDIISSRYFFTSVDDPLAQQGSYARLDGRLTLETTNGRWAVDLIGKNLTDRTIALFGASAVDGSVGIRPEEPRNLALQFRFHW